MQDTYFEIQVLAELSIFFGWFGIYYDGPPVVLSLLQVPIDLSPIGSAGVDKLADDFLGCPRLKWVAPLDGGIHPWS